MYGLPLQQTRTIDTDSDPVLTFLAPGNVRALEVLNREGQWISAPPIEGTFVVNVGDQLQRYRGSRLSRLACLEVSDLEQNDKQFIYLDKTSGAQLHRRGKIFDSVLLFGELGDGR